MDPQQFSNTRSHLYHLTASGNLPSIRSTRTLFPASALLRQADQVGVIQHKRANHIAITRDGHEIVIRDQKPLHAGNTGLQDGWTFEQFILHLNDHVFFWPGTINGPIDYGLRHHARYESEEPKIIRVETKAIIDANNDVILKVCKYNSGSPRCSGGLPSPRGPNTFVSMESASLTPSQVVEVVVEGDISLPESAMVGVSPGGPWTSLF